jgi:acetyltransferase-like isoleucine patch superfamily enzyme
MTTARNVKCTKKKYSNHFLKDNLKEEIKKKLSVVGKWSYGSPKIYRYNWKNKIYIGNFCSIGPEVKIIIGGNHRTDWVTTSPLPDENFNFDNTFANARKIKNFNLSKGDLFIKNDVWIGAFSIILSGITLGNGCVIAAGSVVTKDVKPYTIVGGVPAKFLRSRFNKKQSKFLNESGWWDLEDEKINFLSQYLLNKNVSEFIKKFKDLKNKKVS